MITKGSSLTMDSNHHHNTGKISSGKNLAKNTTTDVQPAVVRNRRVSGASKITSQTSSSKSSSSNGPSNLRKEIPEEDRLLNTDLTTGDDTHSESSRTSGSYRVPSKSPLDDDQLMSSFRSFFTNGSQPLIVKIELNIIAWILFIIALSLRLWRIDFPRNIV